MIRFFKLVKSTPILIILLILLFFYMPSAIMLQPEVERNAIVSAVGIDKKDDLISMSFLCFVPQTDTTYSEKLQVLTCEGQNISDNLQRASLILGRNVNLNHIQTIILSNEVMQEDVSHILDFFARAPVITRGCMLAGTNKKAEDVIKLINSLNNESGMKIEEILLYTENNYFTKETTIDSFYSGYFSPTKTSYLTFIEVSDDDANGLALQQNEESEDNSGTGNEEKQLFANGGQMVLLKEGKMAGVFSLEEVQGISFVSPIRSRALITLKDVEIDNYKKESVTYETIDNKTTRSIQFENGIPLIKYKVRMSLDLYEVVDKGKTEPQSLTQHEISPYIKSEIEKFVKLKFADAINVMRETRTDVLGIYELLMKSDRKAFCDFLETLEDKDDFLSNVIFAISVDCKPL